MIAGGRTSFWLSGLLGLGLMGCVPAAAEEKWSLVPGTLVEARIRDSLPSYGKKSEALSARVIGDVTNARGQVVIPAGSVVSLRVSQHDMSLNRSDRTYPLKATSVMIRGQFYALGTPVEPVERARAHGATYRAGAGVVVMPGTLVLFSLPQSLVTARP